jgi:hypothetical protein
MWSAWYETQTIGSGENLTDSQKQGGGSCCSAQDFFFFFSPLVIFSEDVTFP